MIEAPSRTAPPPPAGPATRADPQPGRLLFIDALRGVASLAVVLFHTVAARHVPLLLAVMPAWLLAVLQRGHLGVAVFFVLSGFVIALSLHGRTMDAGAIGRFVLRRSLRLDPPYWVAMALAIGADLLAQRMVQGHHGEGYSLPQIVAHLFYLQDLLGYRQVNSVFWTLCLEIQFYLVHVLLLATGRARLAFPLALLLSLAWPAGVGPDVPHGLFLPLWHGFLLGTACFLALREALPRPAFWAYALAVLAAGAWHGDEFPIACALTAMLIQAVGSANRLHLLLGWRWIQGLGTISYSLYLVHNPVTGAVFRVCRRLGLESSAPLELGCWLLSLAACIAAASALWAGVERPSMRLAHHVALGRKKAAAVPASA